VHSITPSLVILDYHLPGIDGLDLADRLRANQGLESVPILMISANPPSRKALQQHGITFLAKPFDLTALLKAVEQLLGKLPE
jgi:CheY-like chemotaxis protein